MTSKLATSSAVLLILLAVSASHGTVLAPGGAVTVTGTTSLDTWHVVADVTTPFEIHGVTGALLYKGALQDRVMKSDALGTMVFGFRIRDTQPGLNGYIISVAREGFAGYSTDVDFRTDYLGDVGPDYVKRSSDGNLLDYQFNNTPIYSGLESLLPYAITDAPSFAKTGYYTIYLKDGTKINLKAFAPAVPEPAGLSLLALSTLALLRTRRPH